MSTATKKLHRRSLYASSIGRLVIRRDPKTGQLVAGDVISSKGNLVVKGGPITGGNTHPVFMPQGRTKLPGKKIDELVRLMKLKYPA